MAGNRSAEFAATSGSRQRGLSSATNYSGYKNHTKVDACSRVVEAYSVTDAAVHDSQAIGELIQAGGSSVFADIAYDGHPFAKYAGPQRAILHPPQELSQRSILAYSMDRFSFLIRIESKACNRIRNDFKTAFKRPLFNTFRARQNNLI